MPQAGIYLSRGAEWKVVASVFHPPLSYYLHGYLLKDGKFKDQDEHLFYARLITAVFPVILGFFIFKFAKETFGAAPAIAALLLYTCSPNVIAHSCLIQPDMLAATFIFLGFYFYRGSLADIKNFKKSLLAGIVFGLALLTKYTAVFLVPIYLLLSARQALIGKIRIGRLARHFILICIAGLFVLNLGYKFTGSFTRLKEFPLKSKFFTSLSKVSIMGQVPLPVPGPFVAGFDIDKHITERGHPSFLMGEKNIKGWRHYFLVAFLIKTTIPFLLLLAIAPFYRLNGKEELLIPIGCLVFPFIFFTNSNPGLRYLLPVFPFLFLYASTLADVFNGRNTEKMMPQQKTKNRMKELPAISPAGYKKRVLLAAVPLLLVWHAVESFAIHPHYLAYFNEFIGGPENGYKYLADSNIDWGQDRFLVLKFIDKNPDIKFNPPEPSTGRFLINVNELQDVFRLYEKNRWLRMFKPSGNIGYSWLLYDIKLQDFKNLLDRNPEDAYLNYCYGCASGNMDFLTKAIQLDSHLEGAREELASLCIAANNLPAARKECEQLLRIAPRNYTACKHLSSLYEMTGNTALAKKYKKEYKIAKILSSYSVFVSTDENYYRRKIEANPEDAESWNNLGFTLWMKNDLDSAIDKFKKARSLKPNNINYLGNLIVACGEKGLQQDYTALRQEYAARFGLIESERTMEIQYGDDRMVFEDVLVLPVEE